MKIGVVGLGYVGLVSAAGLASLGHDVRGVDRVAARTGALRGGDLPVLEPGLHEALGAASADGRLQGVESVAAAVQDADACFLCVGTPQGERGLDMTAVIGAVREVEEHAPAGLLIAVRSTVAPEQIDLVRPRRSDLEFALNPETFAEGQALNDFQHPDRLIFGVETERAAALLDAIYSELAPQAPRLVMTPQEAAIAKVATNAWLAARVAQANLIARWCAAAGADVEAVLAAVGGDARIGRQYMRPGLGFGGSCLPKDTLAMEVALEAAGVEAGNVARAVRAANEEHAAWVADEITRRVPAGATLAFWGLAFKGGTNDTRSSPAIVLAEALAARGFMVHAYDPAVRSEHLPESVHLEPGSSAEDTLHGAEALVIATDWPEFAQADLGAIAAAMSGDQVFDARNVLDPAVARAAGLRYWGAGRRP